MTSPRKSGDDKTQHVEACRRYETVAEAAAWLVGHPDYRTCGHNFTGAWLDAARKAEPPRAANPNTADHYGEPTLTSVS
jgi:hypothetical protein